MLVQVTLVPGTQQTNAMRVIIVSKNQAQQHQPTVLVEVSALVGTTVNRALHIRSHALAVPIVHHLVRHSLVTVPNAQMDSTAPIWVPPRSKVYALLVIIAQIMDSLSDGLLISPKLTFAMKVTTVLSEQLLCLTVWQEPTSPIRDKVHVLPAQLVSPVI